MVGRRRAPQPAPPAMPPSSRAKDYKTERPSEIQDELDMVRNRGMAKILNRHFTDTTKKVAQEKAETDAALADLDRRRAQTSEFVPSQGGLNPFDSMYVELQHKREACRRKEKETMLLYQRYVHKYGKKGNIEPPLSKEELSLDSSAAEAAPPPSPLPGKRTPLQPLDEISESMSIVSDDVKFSKFYNKQLAERNKGDPPSDPPGLSSPDPPGKMTNEFSAADDKEEKVSKKVSIVLEKMPELEALTPQTSKDADSSNPPDRVEDTAVSEQELSAPKPDAPEKAQNASESPAEESQDSTPKAQNASEVLVADPPVVKADEPKQEDPKPDPVEGKKESRRESDSDDSEKWPTKEVTTEIPSAAGTSDDEETDIRSMISGLTSVNSVSARQVMDEIVNEMDIFIKTETEEIRKILEVEEEKTSATSYGNSSGSVRCDESVRVTLKAEAMAQEMQNILGDFKKEEASVAAGSTSQHDADKSNASSNGYPRKFDSPNPTEEWMVYYDETFQREYYHETHRNHTQWEPPTSKPKLRFEQQAFSDDMMSETLSPRGLPRRQSRRSVYRKRMRKSRVRRFIGFSFLLSCVAVSCWHWQTNHPDKSYPEAMEATFRNIDWEPSAAYIKDKSMYIKEKAMYITDIAMDKATYIKDKVTYRYIKDNFEYTLTDRKAREASERLDSELKAKRERRAKMDAERKAKEETDRKAAAERQAAAERKRQEKIAAELKVKEEAHRKEIELKEKQAKKKAEEEGRRRELEREEAEQHAFEEREALKRPWGCNLPLSFIVHPRCRRLARLNPIYKETDLLNSFLQ